MAAIRNYLDAKKKKSEGTRKGGQRRSASDESDEDEYII